MSFSAFYARFRGSPFFPALLVASIIGWMGLSIGAAHGLIRRWEGFDDPGSWGTLNVALSMEASISTSLLLMDMARSEALLRKQLAYMQHQNEAVLAFAEATDMRLERIENALAHGAAHRGAASSGMGNDNAPAKQ